MNETAARREGFVPIGAYGVIGDGRSGALVATDGAIDWWAVPAMDSPGLRGRAGPGTGGAFTLEPAVPYRVTRRYLPDTNVLETTFSTDGGLVRVVDAAQPRRGRAAGVDGAGPMSASPSRWASRHDRRGCRT